MSAIVRFTPLYGVESVERALSYILEIDGFNILLDCGWNDRFDEELVAPLREFAPKVDAVLVSHPDLAHIGALPYAVAHCALEAPIYSTLPVWRMGQLFLYDAHQSREQARPFDKFDLDDIDRAFDRFIQMKYQQHLPLSGKGAGIMITPFAAGHTLGGTVWKIKKDAEEIVYAVDFNHRKERTLNPTALQNISRPSHLILGASYGFITPTLGAGLAPTPGSAKPKMVDVVLDSLRLGGNVLMPVDTAARIIEISLLLDEAFTLQKITKSGSICVLHHVAASTFDYARSMIEWMSDSIANRFDLHRENPFSFRNVVICQERAELDAVPSPKVVLASQASLEYGFAREIFMEWASDGRNVIVLTDFLDENTLAAKLATLKRGEQLSLSLERKVPLEGAELREWREAKRRAADEAAARAAQSEVTAARDEEREQGSGSDDSDEEVLDGAEDEEDPTTKVNGATLAGSKISRKSTLQVMFPYVEKRRTWDDYGEVVDMTQFMIGEDPAGPDAMDLDGMERFLPSTMGNAPVGMNTVAEEIPTKYVETKLVIPVRCSVKISELVGVADGRSVRQLVTSIGPRRIVIVHSTKDEALSLRDSFLAEKSGLNLKNDEVICPPLGRTTDLTSDTSVYRLSLHYSLFSDCQWNRIGDVDIAYVTGRLVIGEDEGALGLAAAPQEGHPSVFVGDIELRELKEAISEEAGIRAEFAGGALCVQNRKTDSVVLVKKVGPAEVLVEGAFCEEYFKIRELLYGRFVVL
mmetsp:Transcript_2299/g.3954  ORF Transcript_2299/g.3954 Transcript_2299/m.3954 type:complete len:754 (-) Transcript_2299:2243-4504(-)